MMQWLLLWLLPSTQKTDEAESQTPLPYPEPHTLFCSVLGHWSPLGQAEKSLFSIIYVYFMKWEMDKILPPQPQMFIYMHGHIHAQLLDYSHAISMLSAWAHGSSSFFWAMRPFKWRDSASQGQVPGMQGAWLRPTLVVWGSPPCLTPHTPNSLTEESGRSSGSVLLQDSQLN